MYQQLRMAPNVYYPTICRPGRGLTKPQEKLQEAAASEICGTDIDNVGSSASTLEDVKLICSGYRYIR